MNKKWAILIASISAVITLIIASGYGYIFKAIGLNLKNGSLSPSTDDGEKFPFRSVANRHPESFKKNHGYNSHILSEELTSDLRKTRASSLIVVKENRLLYEQYWKNHRTSSVLNSFSIAKSILSILIGCAIQDGYLKSEDQLVSSVIEKYKNSKYGKYLTFRHLMTMQAGFDWKEEYHHPFAPNSKQYFIDDLAEQTLSIDLKKMPGKEYEYQSISAQLLGIALKKATGKALSSYLSEKIWKPLGMEFPAKWTTDERGLEKAFCCIHATALDFAKIGQLILNEGRWNDRQIISKDYCRKMLAPTEQNSAFGYGVWADDDYILRHRFFYGFLGQFIVIIPEQKMVIVKTGHYNRLDIDEKLRPCQVRLLIDEFKNCV